MNRRDFIKNAAITSSALIAGAHYSPAFGMTGAETKNARVRWSMGWILWRDFSGRKIPLTEAIQNLSDLGLDGIEFSPRKGELEKNGFTRESFRELLAQKKLSVSGNYFGGNFQDASQKEKIIASFKETLENLKFYGAKNVIVGPPGRNVKDIPEAIRGTVPMLNELGKMAKGAGIQLGLHPHVNTIVETPEEIDMIMELTSPKYVRMAPDTGHILMGGGNVLDILRKYSDRLSYFHFKDAAGRFNRPDFGPNMRELGKGDVDYPGIMQLLKKIKFSGWLNVEQDKTFMTPEESAAESAKYINGTLKPIYT